MTDGNEIDWGGSAFPAVIGPPSEFSTGMSLRDWFAGKFLAGAATDNSPLDVRDAADQFDVDTILREHWDHVARAAYIAADAMIAARKTHLNSHASLIEERDRLREELKPFADAGGMLPMTFGPDNEPVADDEEVSIRCVGFPLGDVTAADLIRAYALIHPGNPTPKQEG